MYQQDSPAHQAYQKQEQARQALRARIVDQVKIGDRVSEEQHDLQGEHTATGPHQGETWRHAADGGWFSYALGVQPDQPMLLRCRYWGSDVGRAFDILIDGRKIATVTLAENAPGTFFTMDYAIPQGLSQDRDKITVRFQAHEHSTAGGIFGLAVLKSSELISPRHP